MERFFGGANDEAEHHGQQEKQFQSHTDIDALKREKFEFISDFEAVTRVFSHQPDLKTAGSHPNLSGHGVKSGQYHLRLALHRR